MQVVKEWKPCAPPSTITRDLPLSSSMQDDEKMALAMLVSRNDQDPELHIASSTAWPKSKSNNICGQVSDDVLTVQTHRQTK